MNTVGVLLSASCLAAALIELRIRSDWAGRRMGAILAAVAWATMGCVALDQSRMCATLQRQQAVGAAVRHAENIDNTPLPEVAIQWPDGTKLEQYTTASKRTEGVTAEWRAKPNGRL